MLADEIIARLETKVSDLSSRVYGAADLSALVRQGNLPQVTPAAHVIPAGMSAGRTASLTGNFSQSVGRLITVVLSFRARDKTSARGLNGVEAVIDDVIRAIIGWTPDPASVGVFQLRGYRLVSLVADALVYQIDFVLPDTLEVTS